MIVQNGEFSHSTNIWNSDQNDGNATMMTMMMIGSGDDKACEYRETIIEDNRRKGIARVENESSWIIVQDDGQKMTCHQCITPSRGPCRTRSLLCLFPSR